MIFPNFLPATILEDLKNKEKFACRVCGAQCPIAPDPPDRAVCEEHCEDHEFQRYRCIHCDKPAPDDWFSDYMDRY